MQPCREGRRGCRERTDPDGEEGDGNEDGGGDGADGVGPAARAVHDAVEHAQPPLHQRRARRVQDDLEVALRAWARCQVRRSRHCTSGERVGFRMIWKWPCAQRNTASQATSWPCTPQCMLSLSCSHCGSHMQACKPILEKERPLCCPSALVMHKRAKASASVVGCFSRNRYP